MKPVTDHPFSESLLSDTKYFWNCRTPDQLAAYHKKLKRRTEGDNDYTALLAITQNNRKLFSLISSAIQTMDGWCSIPKACAMASLVLAMKPKLYVELGVWAGRSLLPVAFAMNEIGSGDIIGIDPYSANASVEGEFGEHKIWWSSQQMHDDIKAKFWQHVTKFGVGNRINLIEKRSDEVTPIPCDILHEDGNHTDQAIRDAERFGPSVNLGGIIICDDLKWQGGGPIRAIDALEEMGFVEVFRVEGDGDCWNCMQKVK